jgi:hypothetical protein
MTDYIKEGDIVNIYWEHIRAEFNLEVLGRPCEIGDSWNLKRPDGTLVNVIFYGKMERVKAKEERS